MCDSCPIGITRSLCWQVASIFARPQCLSFFLFLLPFLGRPIELLAAVPMIDSNQRPGTSGRSVTAFGNFQSKRPLWTPRAVKHIIGSRKGRRIWKKKRRKKANRVSKLPVSRRGLKSTVRKHSRIRGGPSHPSSRRVG